MREPDYRQLHTRDTELRRQWSAYVGRVCATARELAVACATHREWTLGVRAAHLSRTALAQAQHDLRLAQVRIAEAIREMDAYIASPGYLTHLRPETEEE